MQMSWFRYSTGVQWAWDQVTVKAISWDSHIFQWIKPCSGPMCPEWKHLQFLCLFLFSLFHMDINKTRPFQDLNVLKRWSKATWAVSLSRLFYVEDYGELLDTSRVIISVPLLTSLLWQCWLVGHFSISAMHDGISDHWLYTTFYNAFTHTWVHYIGYNISQYTFGLHCKMVNTLFSEQWVISDKAIDNFNSKHQWWIHSDLYLGYYYRHPALEGSQSVWVHQTKEHEFIRVRYSLD